MFDLKGALKDLFYALTSIFIGFLVVSPIVILSGCTSYKYEISNTIQPKIKFLDTDEIALEYSLGPITVIDNIELENTKFNRFLKEDGIVLDLAIFYDDCDCSSEQGFIYYFRGNRLNKKATKPLDLKAVMRYSKEIPGFKWFVYNGEELKDNVPEVKDKDKTVIKEKTEKEKDPKMIEHDISTLKKL